MATQPQDDDDNGETAFWRLVLIFFAAFTLWMAIGVARAWWLGLL